MSLKKLKIVSISSEIAPFSKSGGLGDVANSLPKALKKLGHKVIAITPFYGQIIEPKKHKLKMVYENVEVFLNSKESVFVNYWKGYLTEDLPVYFIENKKYFSKRKAMYGSAHENARFLIFDVAALKLVSLLQFEANIVHCHDWQTGLIPFYLKTKFRYSKTLRKAKTVFTIHNLVFQLGRNWWEVPLEKKDYGKKRIPHISDPDIEYLNFAKRAILTADAINTVSEQYKEEIMTRHFGQDLDRILKNRADKLFGIINGIDHNLYNPETDKNIRQNYNSKNIDSKKTNKEYLQKKLKLSVDADIPLLGFTSRVTFQKGFELIVQLLEPLMSLDLQIIIMGDGDKKYINEFKKYQKKYPKKIIWIPFKENEKIETLIYAGADIFLLPSHHEPCGINQLIAMRYGCIPVVRRVGGLNDTVTNYNPKTNRGNGFSFSNFNAFSLFGTIVRALENYRHKESWKKLIIRAMEESTGWEIPAKKYISFYKQILKNNKKI